MVKIVFRSDGRADCVVDADEGQALLEIAKANGVAGILGDCGGEMSCGTCHAYIDRTSFDLLPSPSLDEQIMLEDGVLDPKPYSRLCCQVVVTPALDGIIVEVPGHF